MATPHDRMLWPFFDEPHRRLATEAEKWAASLEDGEHPSERAAVDARCREFVARLGKAGLLRHCLRAADGGATADLDARSICLLRQILAHQDGLADFAFAMQGLGSAPLSLAGSERLRAAYLPRVATGAAIAAFALSEPEAGSDVAAMQTSARRDGASYVLDGSKTWISNGGIADFYCVFARTAPGQRRSDGSVSADGISAFVVEPGDRGFAVAERIDAMAPHPLARITFEGCRVPAERLIGEEGEGFRIAMRTLDIFRTSVAAAACGFARRAMDEALRHARSRGMFGRMLADFQLTQTALAEMATALDAAELLTYRAAWLRDNGHPFKSAAAMAKLGATEHAQTVIDRALQMFGGRGLVQGEIIERLYREVRALRIYEGASEVQKLIIGRELLR
ncbi:MAG TPA: acyl-CoA dehydrogenase family protein [Steroidobacteraceae bacterium]|nr:acyl-CoA dehydrogenase family protein [Steroidobacteraceae bacterium]